MQKSSLVAEMCVFVNCDKDLFVIWMNGLEYGSGGQVFIYEDNG